MATLTRLSTPEAPDGMSGEYAGTSGYDYMVQVFSGVMHGFALRGNMKVERNRWAKEASAKACRDWYVVYVAFVLLRSPSILFGRVWQV
jgi:hypothetical protein